MIIKLSQPTQINGSQLTEIDLQLEVLKGKDLLELDAGFKKYVREYIPVPYLDLRFQTFVAGRVCGINPEDLGEVSAPDLVEICTAVQNFLLKSGSPPVLPLTGLTEARVPAKPSSA
jgi:hypothetical protein